jgi:hypothetical protein
MNPDYRSLSEHRRHRWEMPGSPIISTFKNGKPLVLEIKESETFADKPWTPQPVKLFRRVKRTSNYQIDRGDSAQSKTPTQQVGELSSRKLSMLERYNYYTAQNQ